MIHEMIPYTLHDLAMFAAIGALVISWVLAALIFTAKKLIDKYIEQ